MAEEVVGDLPDELWSIIGSKLVAPSDRLRFRAVSKTWNSLLPFRQPPWLMLAESNKPKVKDDDDADNLDAQTPPRRGFVCLGEEKIHEIDLPEIHEARCLGSTGNWLITIYLDKSIRLLNPFSRLQLHLPSLSTLDHQFWVDPNDDQGLPPEIYRDYFVEKVTLSSPPAPGEDCIAVALYSHYKVLSFARPGDTSWTPIPVKNKPYSGIIGIDDMIFYKQKLYGVTFDARLMVCDIHGDAPKLSYITDALTKVRSVELKYLVECSGDLLLVIKFMDTNFNPEKRKDGDSLYATNRFQVYKLDFTTMRFNEVKSLGEYSLFLGLNTSISLLASDYFGVMKNNCIYFTDDFSMGYRGSDEPGGHDMGVFDLEDSSVTPHFKGVSTSLNSPPIWIVPA